MNILNILPYVLVGLLLYFALLAFVIATVGLTKLAIDMIRDKW